MHVTRTLVTLSVAAFGGRLRKSRKHECRCLPRHDVHGHGCAGVHGGDGTSHESHA